MKIENYNELEKAFNDTAYCYKLLRTEIDKIPANEALSAKIYLLQQMQKIQEAMIEVKKTVQEIEKHGYYTPKETA